MLSLGAPEPGFPVELGATNELHAALLKVDYRLRRPAGRAKEVFALPAKEKAIVGLRPISANLFRMFFVKTPTKTSS